ncbi:MAG TPA: NADH-quinone oxidoreductase subunit L [Acidimicrobiia bacterium]
MKTYWFLDHAWLVPLIPAVSFAVILLLGKRFGPRAAWIGICSVGASFVLAVGSVIQWIQHVGDSTNASGTKSAIASAFGGISVAAEGKTSDSKFVAPIVHTTTWLQSGGTKLHVGIQIDGLAVLLMFVVTTVSLLVHVYSTEYLHGDRRFNHYFAALSLFTASMLLLVVSSSTLELLMGWELVGLCSFLLIGHWWEEEANSSAALKAFFTTRTGDIGLLTGVIMTFFVVQRATGHGSFDILAVNASAMKLGAAHQQHTLLLLCALALLLAIMGKSGQFPLHTWLPDAMAGPTPVSALIHAATMVVAGVYLGARVYPIFYQGFHIAKGPFNIMAIVGGITIIIGAALAFVQDDIKKVLAYSTISQLGYMVMALGVGAWTAAIFHLFTHAFFKADLFLGAGSVSHSGAHHSFDMKKDMGGLRKYMPRTFITFLIATAALIGLPLTAGFFSKDEILAVAGANGFTFFKVVGLVGAVMTAAYMTRCVYLTFFGEYRGGHASPAAHGHDEHAHAPHESNNTILIPLYVLSFLAIASGYLLAPEFKINKFTDWVTPHIGNGFVTFSESKFHWADPGIAVAAGLIGIAIAYTFYWTKSYGQDAAAKSPMLRAGKAFLVNKYYLDHLYTDIIVGGIKGPIANAAYWVNQNVIDAVLRYTGKGAVVSANFVYNFIDQRAVDGFYNGTALITGEAGGETRKLQTGRLQEYAWVIVGSVGVFVLALAIWKG